jgi:hypothetical protein
MSVKAAYPRPASVNDKQWASLVEAAQSLPPPDPHDLLSFRYADNRPGVHELNQDKEDYSKSKLWPIRIGSLEHKVYKASDGRPRLAILDPAAVKSVDVNWLAILLGAGCVNIEDALRVELNSNRSLGSFCELHQFWGLPIKCPKFPQFEYAGDESDETGADDHAASSSSKDMSQTPE